MIPASRNGTSGDPADPQGVIPEVSFVVIAYNEQAHIASTLQSILAQSDLGTFEIVVVDDGSNDRTADVVAELGSVHPEIHLVRHEVNSGRGAARSTGVRSARGGLVAMVDADILLPPHWWRTCRAELAEYDVVGGTAVPDGDVTYIHSASGLSPKVVGSSTVVTGNNGAYRAEVLHSVSFDAARSEGEDIAINHALLEAGYRLRNIEGLVVEHREDKGFRRSMSWLYLSGIGATRQLWTYRVVRMPDLASGGWLATLAAALVMRGRPARALALPVAYLGITATAHLAPRFELDPRHPLRVARAICLDALLLAAYFSGRVSGIRALVGGSAPSHGDPDSAT